MSKILIENLKIFAFHGVLPEEKILGTNYILNVEIQADLQKASESDDLQDTIIMQKSMIFCLKKWQFHLNF